MKLEVTIDDYRNVVVRQDGRKLEPGEALAVLVSAEGLLRAARAPGDEGPKAHLPVEGPQ